jgi:hypothetical protein
MPTLVSTVNGPPPPPHPLPVPAVFTTTSCNPCYCSFVAHYTNRPQVSIMPSILPLVILSHHGYAQPAAAAAALSLVVVCHMLSNVTNTLFDFKTGQSYFNDFIDANVALEPCCCIRC